MLLDGYVLRFRPVSDWWGASDFGVAEATLPVDIGDLIPVLARSVSKYQYDEAKRLLVYQMDTVFVKVEPRKVTFSGVAGREQAEQMMTVLNETISGLVEHEGG